MRRFPSRFICVFGGLGCGRRPTCALPALGSKPIGVALYILLARRKNPTGTVPYYGTSTVPYYTVLYYTDYTVLYIRYAIYCTVYTLRAMHTISANLRYARA